MTRTTLNIDTTILRELGRLKQGESRSMGDLVSELLAEALVARRRSASDPIHFRFFSQSMKARVDLEDKEAIHAILDDDGEDRSP